MPDLNHLLRSTFGFSGFRANQESVCRAATDGRDVLLVMPTGAGKSLCYQLPAVARGGTALVVSPLIALMDDQADKLTAAGLRVARIHSGLSRDSSRQACRDFLEGNLQFLFIAPERMRVPGFPEMLARRKPALIAIDEAHCISAWGHDFRPDYRLLGDYLPALRPAPVIALTATATPQVQRDIVAQLQLSNPALFIHGFRRENLAVEVVEMSRPRRAQFAAKFLADPAHRPAIVYAPSRRAAEELAAELNLKIKSSPNLRAPFMEQSHRDMSGLATKSSPNLRAPFMEQSHRDMSGSATKSSPDLRAPFMEQSHRDMSGPTTKSSPDLRAPFMEQSHRDMSGSATKSSPNLRAPFMEQSHRDMSGPTTKSSPIAAAYHAGLAPDVRAHVQQQFQAGRLEVVVATIAFGMGIDKADVRSVLHVALPASVEAFYQEIGRAGRDGLPARTVLLYSFVDKRIHETFLERDYPPLADMTRVAQALTAEPMLPETIASKLRMDRDLVAKALEKLAAQGAAQFDIPGNVRATGVTGWQPGYQQQLDFRRAQIDAMMSFAETRQCRMTALIRHFGDTADAHRPCGHCDFCAPSAGSAQPFLPPTPAQDRDLRTILRALEGAPRSTGKLHTGLALTPDRKVFDALLDGLARAGLIALIPDTFTNPEGRQITYKKASLTPEGRNLGTTEPLGVLLRAESSSTPAKSSKKKRPTPPDQPARGTHASRSDGPTSAPKPSTPQEFHRPRPAPAAPEESLNPTQQALDRRLREWRKTESERMGLPQFFVLGTSTLRNIVLAHPRTLSQLSGIPGIGPEKLDRFGPAILQLLNA